MVEFGQWPKIGQVRALWRNRWKATPSFSVASAYLLAALPPGSNTAVYNHPTRNRATGEDALEKGGTRKFSGKGYEE